MNIEFLKKAHAPAAFLYRPSKRRLIFNPTCAIAVDANSMQIIMIVVIRFISVGFLIIIQFKGFSQV